ncbi:hypothetical protein M8C21_002561 [Ambrosia artemisiifolia]|uniref:Uncharacterized protein n=1 Tax=Ambrosia artemisiifolia TaxID=4212 RepID=A0AAD5BXL5_AMBAR|nr:hypothetical protein M8C21_002561 [Ambrosia artemisiifolia]
MRRLLAVMSYVYDNHVIKNSKTIDRQHKFEQVRFRDR